MIVPRSSVGSYTGSGASQDVKIGFKPKFVFIWNETDGTKFAVAIQGLADAKAYTANTSGAGTTDLALTGSNGITLTSYGFNLGTSALVNNSAKVYRFFAIS